MPADEKTAKEISTEERKVIVHHVDCTSEWELPKRYSTWTRLVRVTVYVLRFIKNSQREKNLQPRKRLPTEISELHEATYRWFRLVQKVHFSKEWSALSKNEPILNSSALKALKPILGEDSLLRLGRTRTSNTVKNILLYCRSIAYRSYSSTARIALLFMEAHNLCHLRQKYWIIESRNLVKAHIRVIVLCDLRASVSFDAS